ncbi:hypothetical protein JCM8097_008532 [Rhodosporidiobolus ruineniae]
MADVPLPTSPLDSPTLLSPVQRSESPHPTALRPRSSVAAARRISLDQAFAALDRPLSTPPLSTAIDPPSSDDVEVLRPLSDYAPVLPHSQPPSDQEHAPLATSSTTLNDQEKAQKKDDWDEAPPVPRRSAAQRWVRAGIVVLILLGVILGLVFGISAATKSVSGGSKDDAASSSSVSSSALSAATSSTSVPTTSASSPSSTSNTATSSSSSASSSAASRSGSSIASTGTDTASSSAAASTSRASSSTATTSAAP